MTAHGPRVASAQVTPSLANSWSYMCVRATDSTGNYDEDWLRLPREPATPPPPPPSCDPDTDVSCRETEPTRCTPGSNCPPISPTCSIPERGEFQVTDPASKKATPANKTGSVSYSVERLDYRDHLVVPQDDLYSEYSSGGAIRTQFGEYTLDENAIGNKLRNITLNGHLVDTARHLIGTGQSARLNVAFDTGGVPHDPHFLFLKPKFIAPLLLLMVIGA